jgi:DNA-binding response OmpR family regulator
MKILIIEDEKPLRESIQKYLEYQGYVCETAEDFIKGK